MTVTHPDNTIDSIRRFNRFYTRQIGVLQENLHDSALSLPEARIIYELAQHENMTATALSTELSLDAGYLSRLLRGLEKRELITRSRSETDARQTPISLTMQGKELFITINQSTQEEIGTMLSGLSTTEQHQLISSMHSIETLLGTQSNVNTPYMLRPHKIGDMGWITHRQGILYAQQFGWDGTYEALVAQITADFIRNFKPEREHCWIAERHGEMIGSVFLIEESEDVARIRLLYVEPKARGLGVGQTLVNECIQFAKQVGYSKIILWTNSILVSATRIYESFGFRLTSEDPHHSFGHDLVGQIWELELDRD